MSVGEILRRLEYFLRRDRYTRELEEEMRLHRELRAERLEGGGLAPASARYAARRKFGNTTNHQERSRDMWGLGWLENATDDLRFAARRLRNRPAFAISAILVAALGIGATAAVFSAVDAALLRPLPFARPHELVSLEYVDIPFDDEAREERDKPRYVDILDVAEMRLFSSVAAYAAGGMNLEDALAPRRVRVGVVTASFFSTLGVSPAHGRTFTADEGKPPARKVVVLSHGLWRTQYGARQIIGTRIALHGGQYEVIGIMPRGFGFPSESDVWIPMSVPTTTETFRPFRGWLPKEVMARLAPGVTPGVAAREMLLRWERQAGPRDPKRKTNLDNSLDYLRTHGAANPIRENFVGGTQKKPFLFLMGATVLLLLIAAANIANLLLSDGAGRRREIALREVLGASRGRVVRQLLAESIVLAFTGAILGVALAPAALGLLRNLMPDALLGTALVQVNLRVLAFATLLALVTGIVFGLWPALGTSRVDAGEAIKSGGGPAATAGRLGATRQFLITAEVALTVMLLVGSGLMLKSFHRLMTQELGMKTENAGTLELTFARPSGAAEAQLTGTLTHRMQIVRQILAKLEADPQITAAGVVNDLPLRGGTGIGVSVSLVGAKTPKGVDFPRYLIASGGYFAAMGIPLLRGRVFEARDDTIGPRVAIASRAMAEQFWPGGDPIGKAFHWGGDTSVTYTVVGVVADVRERNVDVEVQPQLYFSMDERGLSNLGLVARSDLPPGALLARLNAAIRAAAPSQAVFNLRMMDDAVAKSVSPRRTNTVLIAVFGALALVLSAFGVYAVVSYGVAQRSREFGIRTALGARRADILSLVGRDMTKLLVAGLVVGLASAWALSRVIASLLYGVAAHDPAIYAIVPLVLIVPVAVATLVPSLRAARVSPTEVMRAE